RLGIKTLGELAALSPAAVADRFGAAGLHALELAAGVDGALRPRPASELVRESLELHEAASGIQLERGLGLLIARLLARRARAARLREAIRQARAAAGPDAALRVLTVDPDSRCPERRAVLAPFE